MLIHGDMLQKLVNKIIDDIGYNINIIDTNGIIIASGNQQRIGSFHKIGKQASDEERRVDIYPVTKITTKCKTRYQSAFIITAH